MLERSIRWPSWDALRNPEADPAGSNAQADLTSGECVGVAEGTCVSPWRVLLTMKISYLLANAMQAFTAQPLANQTSDNPFTNAYLLATLIVPHLETYLALHSEIRYLLLEYPPEHFRTVLALQKLLGVDLMKIAQIVNSNSSEHLPFTHLRGISIGSKSEESPTRLLSPSSRSSSNISVSKANYLLTSTASDKDIAKFVSTVWNIPNEVFHYASSQPSTSHESKRRPNTSPLRPRGDSFSPFPKVSPLSPLSLRTKGPLPPTQDSSASTRRAASRTETFGTLKPAKSRRSRSRSRGNARMLPDAFSVMTFDANDDSDFDMEERRLMPLFMKKIGTRQPQYPQSPQIPRLGLSLLGGYSWSVLDIKVLTYYCLLYAPKRDQDGQYDSRRSHMSFITLLFTLFHLPSRDNVCGWRTGTNGHGTGSNIHGEKYKRRLFCRTVSAYRHRHFIRCFGQDNVK